MSHHSCGRLARALAAAVPAVFSCFLLGGCAHASPQPPAELLLVNGKVYTLTWDEPALDGTPAPNAPRTAGLWHPDAEALAIRAGRIVFVGSSVNARKDYLGPATRVVDLGGAVAIPGLVDSHVHIVELGRMLERVNLVGVRTEAEAVERVAERARAVPKGQWVLGYGWDDGAWSNQYPTLKLLSERVPDHPVYLRGLHGYAVWGNRLAFERAKITAATPSPSGGEVRKGPDGKPSGVLLNQAVGLLESAIPPPTQVDMERLVLRGLEAVAAAGYVSVHEAGVDTLMMNAFEKLAAEGRLPVRVYAMLSGRDHALVERWLQRGPDTRTDRMLTTRSVKVFFDGALGSRGARLLEDYSDRPGQRGVSGPDPRFDPKLVAATMKAGFQVAIHAIGDLANREALDYIESVVAQAPEARRWRHRVEHAQLLHPLDIPRFAKAGVIASMNPPHAVEDMSWAADRVGPERVKYAYAWRALRQSGARLVFSSDLPGTDYNAFYGLHSAITRRDKQGQPAGGWHPEQRVSIEEALRGYTTWAAYTAFQEKETGVLAPGRWADITVIDVDPFVTGERLPETLLMGKIVMTIVGGKIVH